MFSVHHIVASINSEKIPCKNSSAAKKDEAKNAHDTDCGV